MQLLPMHGDQALSLDLYRVMKDEVKVAPREVLIERWRNPVCWVRDQKYLWLGRQILAPWHPRKPDVLTHPPPKQDTYTKALRCYVDAWKAALEDYVHSAYDYLKSGTLETGILFTKSIFNG